MSNGKLSGGFPPETSHRYKGRRCEHHVAPRGSRMLSSPSRSFQRAQRRLLRSSHSSLHFASFLVRAFTTSRMAPSKKIIVCCDGTWMDSDNTGVTPTNVTKIARCLNHQGKSLQDPGKTIPQIVYYQSGVATQNTGTLGQNFDGLTGRGVLLK